MTKREQRRAVAYCYARAKKYDKIAKTAEKEGRWADAGKALKTSIQARIIGAQYAARETV